MTTRTDFTPEQWQALRNAPQLVALATAAAGHSGLFGSVAEGFATAGTIAEALRGDDPLIRELFGREEIRAAQDEIKGTLRDVPDRAALGPVLQKAATDTVATALAALAARGTAADVDAFRALLRDIGERVANASREGSFLGFGGERVSEGEREFLAVLASALGSGRVA